MTGAVDRLPDDPVERVVALALDGAGIAWTRGDAHEGDLDIVLADGTRIECKRFHSPRIGEQMSRFPEVIAIQGMEAARRFAAMIARPPVVEDPMVREGRTEQELVRHWWPGYWRGMAEGLVIGGAVTGMALGWLALRHGWRPW